MSEISAIYGECCLEKNHDSFPIPATVNKISIFYPFSVVTCHS
ncbi:hypothetical protein JCM19238_4389 [Vibrio ponticus]|nr:hypothetical protein JCM19238_4389 [Vibrio ponticus]